MLNPPTEDFSIYRPPVSSGKLDGVHYTERDGIWRPSLSYKNTLKDVRRQFTPSEHYRYLLATSGADIRAIQRLENRWNKNYDDFVRATTKIQSLYRAIVSRRYYATIKNDLFISLRQREGFQAAQQQFWNYEYETSIQTVDTVPVTTVALLEIKMKAFYALGDYHNCIVTADQLLDKDDLFEDAYYLKASSYTGFQQYQAAYDNIKILTTLIEAPKIEVYRLNAFICCKVRPPLFLEAVDSLNFIITWNDTDYDAVRFSVCSVRQCTIHQLDYIREYFIN